MLVSEEKQHIYRDGATGGEAEGKEKRGGGATIGLSPNIAGLLCYFGMWVTGIIFLVLEQKNKTVRFHAAQSIVTFGALMLLGVFSRLIPWAGSFLAAALGVMTFVLWLVLMTKAYRGELYRLSWATGLARALLKAVSRGAGDEAPEAMPVIIIEETPKMPRTREIKVSVCAIILNLAALICCNFFYKYIAYYSLVSGAWVRQPLVNPAWWRTWLPVANIAIALSIVGYVIIIASGQRLVQDTVRIILNIFALIAIGSLLSIFPFDFIDLPVPDTLVGLAVLLHLSIAMVAIAAAAIVRLIRLVMTIVRS